MDWWTLGLIGCYAALAASLWGSKRNVFPWFTLLVWFSAIAAIPRLPAWENPNVALIGWIMMLAKDALRVPAAYEAFRATTIQLHSRGLSWLFVGACFISASLAGFFFLTGTQANIEGWRAIAMKCRDALNAGLGMCLLIVCGALWAREFTLRNWWGSRTMRHAILLSLLCLNTAAVELIPAGHGEGDWWQVMNVTRSVIQYALLITWIYLLGRRRDSRGPAPTVPSTQSA